MIGRIRADEINIICIKLMNQFRLQKQLFLFFFFYFPISIDAQVSIGRNHPELNWKTIETSHFKIIYYEGIEILAEEAARAAEQIYDPITQELGVEPGHKTPIIISDYDDESNGLATPLGHYIFIWAQSYKKYTTGSMKWLPEVIAHEFVHQINFWGVRGFPGFWRELLALGFLPTWFIEGLAQYETEQWDVHRDMLLRVATTSNALLPTKRMAGYVGADLIDKRLVYEQGHSLVRYIASKYGKDKIRKILEKHRAFPFSFNLALKRAIGVGERDLIREWRKEIENAYDSNWQRKISLKETGTPFEVDLQGIYGIQWSPDGARVAVVGIEEFDEWVPRLYLFNPDGKNKKCIAGPFINAYFSWSPDSRSIVYSKKRKGRNSAYLDDLFIIDVETKKERALTYSHRATDPHWSPDGNQIIYCVYQGPLSNLALYDLKTGASHILTSFDNWTEVFTPQWSPAGAQIAFSLFDAAGKRDVAIINADGTGFRRLTDDFIDDRYPTWSPDGKQIAYISYQNGNPNLFLKNLISGNIKQTTDVPGGAFNPAFLPHENKIAVVAFEHRSKISAFLIDLNLEYETSENEISQTQQIEWHRTKPDHFERLYQRQHSSPHIIKQVNYRSLSNIRSQITLPYYGYDDAGFQLGLINLSADPLGKHQFLWSITHRKRTHFSINYVNTQFLPIIQLTINKTSLDQGNYISVEDFDFYLWEKFWDISLELSIPFNFGKSILSNHWLWLAGYISKREPFNPKKYDVLKSQFQPFRGWTNSLTIGYSWSTYRPDVSLDIHPKTGAVFSTYYRRSDEFIFSDLQFDQLSAGLVLRKELPIQEHVVAARLRLFFHSGEQPIQRRYALGSLSIRALDKSVEGDRMIIGNFEYRFPLIHDSGLKLWILYFERFCGALYLDAGKAWGTYFRTLGDRQKRDFNEVNWQATTGVMLRHRIYVFGKIPFVIQGGLGTMLPDCDDKNLFLILGSVF